VLDVRGTAMVIVDLLPSVAEPTVGAPLAGTVKVFDVLPDDTWVYPGHGADTTLGAERPSLGEWRERGW
jgi:glyoxylase-like metal-dependent hydrolase (beta-lactamase superfamily II)